MRRILAALLVSATPAAAEVPHIVTDIAPVQAIVSRVMQGAGEPAQIIPAGASPHGYAMRPSEARALAAADLVVWVGSGLTSWLEDPIESLAPDAAQMVLMDVPDVTLLSFREGALFEAHPYDEDHGEPSDHDDHGDHEDHADQEGHEDHGDGEDHAGHQEDMIYDTDHEEGHAEDMDHENHAHGAIDPHLWLDPRNAQVWAAALADRLAQMDPAQAELYRTNAEAFTQELTALEAEVRQMLVPVRQRPFLVLHDGFHYFEARFDIEARGAVFLGDGSSPSPARLKDLRDALAETPVVCAFAEPQMDTGLLRTATEAQGTRIGTLDALGAQGTAYSDLLRGIAVSMRDCLADG